MFSESDYSSSTTSDDCYLSSDNNFKNNLTSFHDENEVTIIKQFVHDVIDFSSQYGSDLSISYTAYNLTGKPSKFPDYGDFPETYAMVIQFIYFLFNLIKGVRRLIEAGLNLDQNIIFISLSLSVQQFFQQ